MSRFKHVLRWSTFLKLAVVAVLFPWSQSEGSGLAQEAPASPKKEQFIPADQLETVFERDGRGVLMKGEEFRALVEKAAATNQAPDAPIPIITEQATLNVTPGDQQAAVVMNLKVHQYAEGWQVLRIRAGNLLVEKVEIDGQPAIITRDPADPTALLLAHETPGEFTAIVTMSTQLVTLGSDRNAAFELPVIPAVQLTVSCPAGRHLLVNDLSLDRPASDDASAEYSIPVGNAPNVRLRWVVQQKESEAQTLVFVRTDGKIQVQKEALRWESDSRLSVFGGTINKVIARVPSQLEITSVESSGLEAWTLDDDPEHAGYTRVTLTWRQPFTNDRMIQLKAVAAAVDGGQQRIPTLEFSEVTSHAGRLVVAHEEGLRLKAEAGAGVRAVSAAELSLSTDVSVFDFWLQQFELQVAAKPRDRELFAESAATLVVDDTELTFTTLLTIEALNAPLFEIPVRLPSDWQLKSITAQEQPVPWTAGSDQDHILIRLVQPVAPGTLLTLTLRLTRTIADPDVEQKLTLPTITAAETTNVGGTYRIQFSDDLTVAALSLAGLTPIAGNGTEQVFQNPGTPVSGEISIVRKPARLATRSVLRTWADSRQQSLDAEIVTDVLDGTVRTLTIRLSESLGPDVRFDIRSAGPVPGLTQVRKIRPVTLIEQSAGTPADGLRPFILKLDHRFAGSLSLHAFVQQSRTGNSPISAPVVQVQDAVRQHGVLVFEASPEQHLATGPEVRLIPGLFIADAGLIDAPAASTGRRIALTYRYVQPGYAFQVNETRFVTNAVPSAVCEQLTNICTLNESGSVQRWCRAKMRSTSVQTLRFSLPDAEHSFLWSTMLNGEPVEVRRDAGDYLVAIPSQTEIQDYELIVLFESEVQNAGRFGVTDQGPVQFSIDANTLRGIPIDVLKQVWQVHYPQSSMLVDSDGQFRAVSGVDQPGWLVSLGHLKWPDKAEMVRPLIGLTIFMLVLFVLTAMVSRRRWKSLVAVGTAGLILGMLTLSSARMQSTEQTMYTVNSMPPGDGGHEFNDSYAGMGPQTAAPDGMGMGMGGGSAVGMGGFGVPERASEIAAGTPPRSETPLIHLSDGINSLFEEKESLQDIVASTPSSQSVRAMNGQTAPAEPQIFQSELQQAAPVDLSLIVPPSGNSLAAVKRGRARLSVNVNLDVPSDYRSREFVSVADAVHQPSVLRLVVQKREHIKAIRLVTALIVVLFAWGMRLSTFLWKLTMSIILLLLAIGLLPLVSNFWQSVLDGMVIGAIISIALAVVQRCTDCCTCPLTWFRSRNTKVLAGLIVAAVHTLSAETSALQAAPFSGQDGSPAATSDARINALTPSVVIPYSAEQSALQADKVFIRQEDFLRLYKQANPDALKAAAASPVGSTVVASFFRTGGLTPVNSSTQILSCEARFVVWSDSETAVSVPLPIGPVAIRSILVGGNEGSVQPLVVGAESVAIQNFAAQQIDQSRQAPIPSNDGPAYAVQIVGKGLHVVDLKFDIPALIEGDLGRADFPLRSPSSGTLEWTLPADGLDAKVHGRTNVFRREGRVITMPVAQLSTIRLQWLPEVQKAVGDVVFHATTAATLSVQNSGLILRSTVTVNLRQGEISELDVTIPDGYSVQSVTGDDVAGWTAQSTDAARSVRLQFRRAVSDATKVTLQLYMPSPSTESLAALNVPISVVRGASRDLGSILLKTDARFHVRSDALSAVTQINPAEAPLPDGDALPGRPMLAWRYTRHPASVTVKVTPTADEMVADVIHGVRLEEQRQLWSTRINLTVTGAPRSRIDIAVPRSFLALDVSGTAIKDWYQTDAAAAGDQAESDLRILSLQLSDARTGSLQIVLQGQMNRDADRTTLTLKPPAILSATKVTSELAVWLDAASESAGIENGTGIATGWTIKPPGAASASFLEISPTAPSLVFQSNAVRPEPLTVKLRQAVSTLIGESVTVTNVTSTAIEITLALNWQIARAGADQFAVELPTNVASAMTFDVPGQRRVTREDIGNGRTRIIIQLQQAMTDRLFVLGTASLPLPSDRGIRSDAPNIVVPQGVPSTMSGQAHFWVLVNQSGGVLQPGTISPDDKVSPEQITTQIPPQLLQQAVAVVKLHPQTSPWTLVYPAQHQVAPAVITLATHTTVIADDGSWRSRHQLQVTNESRQFLPVTLPKDSRLMYCLVQGRPTRVVIRGEGEAARHLIPIPQSGGVTAGFEVEFALAGRFDDSAARIRRQWSSRRLQIPVPFFPEFRDDPEFGISVSRNRWSVYVPESWRATLTDDPDVTNVIEAESDELEDASLLSEVEQAASLLKAARAASGRYARDRFQNEVKLKVENLSRQSANSAGVGQQRNELLSKLSELNADFEQNSNGTLDPKSALGNKYLYEEEQRQNSVNSGNSLQFWSYNSRADRGGVPGVQMQDSSEGLSAMQQSTENEFRFGVTLSDSEKGPMGDDAGRKSGEAFPEADVKFEGESKAGESKSGAEKSEAMAYEPGRLKDGKENTRSQLVQRRGAKTDPAKPQSEQVLEFNRIEAESDVFDSPAKQDIQGLSPDRDKSVEEQAATRASSADNPFNGPMTNFGRSATPTGLLSLKFDIPTDGERIDFLRVGGNPELSLEVRSSESVVKGTGMAWLAVCGVGILLLVGPGRRGQVLVFCLRLFLLLAVVGCLAWLFTVGDLQPLALICCLFGAVGVAVSATLINLRRAA